MIYLFIAIIGASLLYLIFKIFEIKGVHAEAGIMVNYITATICAAVVAGGTPVNFINTNSSAELISCVCLGVGFSLTFTLIGAVTRLLGVAGATIISRMSLVIPAGYSIIYFGEKLSMLKGAGILIALLAIYFTVKSEDETVKKKYGISSILIPILAFIGVGLTDLFMKYVERNYFHPVMDLNFATLLYAAAFCGATVLFFINSRRFGEFLKTKTLVWGILLGVANYGCLYFFLKALTSGLDGSVIFPLNSVGIVIVSTTVSVLFFKEKLNLSNSVGMALAIVSILLIAYS
ncbi:MAG: EamA family transporter [Bacteroidetes bacterium]|nr:EamA family transporter [Bacteroidota bacterium]